MATSDGSITNGLASLNRKLTKTIPDKVYAQVRAALEQSANEIVAEMKRFSPVDTGDLQMSISWTWGNAPKGAMVLGRVATKRRSSFKQGASNDGLRITIYSGGGDTYYAWMVEFGSIHGAAQPFFYPIFRAKKRAAKSRVTRAISKGVKEGIA